MRISDWSSDVCSSDLCGERRRLSGTGYGQRAGGGTRLLCGAEGGRVMSALTNLTIAGARDLLAKGEISARELTEAHIAAVEAARSLNAFITETPEKALEMAEASDARRKAGQAGLLEDRKRPRL